MADTKQTETEENDGLYNGGTAEDWYNVCNGLTEGKRLVDGALESAVKCLTVELEQCRAALEYQKQKRKKAESLLADAATADVLGKADLIASLKDENESLKRDLLAIRKVLDGEAR